MASKYRFNSTSTTGKVVDLDFARYVHHSHPSGRLLCLNEKCLRILLVAIGFLVVYHLGEVVRQHNNLVIIKKKKKTWPDIATMAYV